MSGGSSPRPSSRADGPTPALGARIEANLPALRRFVGRRTGVRLRQKEPCSDIVQSVVREVCETSPAREFLDETAFRKFLLAVAAHKIASKGRRHGAAQRSCEREESPSRAGCEIACVADSSPSRSPSRAAERDEDLARLRAALLDLDEQDRELVLLRRVLGVPPKEVAERLGIAESTVRWRLAAVLTELAGRLR